MLQEDTVESYFEAQALPALTSDHTLAKLDMPRMDHEQLQQALEVMTSSVRTANVWPVA